ncbi:hypothetical protein O1Q96_17585 [Streptomyces sp. Qhu-G9]|uniref:hypothetical protein n=1 Tax=Streptomyces sp. Qhu-G9 TaxID=3452799 RepID=UPI0022AC57F4|nr:hypothetical protein [Streptomyces aurantiacus]WAU81435.1 hypothetical protein O1Q96_17585 [Streptomyces aurantiacus]
MRALFEAATGFPSLLFTAALIVILGFWLLVAFGAAGADSYDADADLDAWGMGGVPVAVAFSILTAFAWLLSLGAVILLHAAAPAGVVLGLMKIVVPVGSLLAAWRLTRLFVRPLHRLSPDEPGPSRPVEALASGGIGVPRTRGEADEQVQDPPYKVPSDAHDRAA